MKITRFIVGPIETNCYLLTDNGEAAVVDPGEATQELTEAIKKSGAKLKYVINSHHHYDHTDGDQEIKKMSGAEILIHENEKPYLGFAADAYLRDNEKIKIGKSELAVLRTPGHSQGSICLIGENLIFTGDTLFYDGYGRTDLAGGSDEEMEDSLNKLHEIIKPGMTVYPGHGEIYKQD